MLLPFSSGKRKLENESLHPETKPYVSISFEGLTLGYPGHIKHAASREWTFSNAGSELPGRSACIHRRFGSDVAVWMYPLPNGSNQIEIIVAMLF